MNPQVFGEIYGGTAPENYQRFFVPAIGGPVAADLIDLANLKSGQRVLDVACGTGVVARLAAERVGSSGSVAGLDVNPGMLAVARSETAAQASINWYEGSAESMPLPDESFDVILCQMGLQFVANKLAAVREMRRILASGGRALISVPGPTPPMFAIMSEALSRHASPDAATFARVVFSLHDGDELAGLLRSGGFREVEIRTKPKTLRVPAPRDFLWQYICSTPLVETVMKADEDTRAALERDVTKKWQEFVTDGGMALEVGMTIGIGDR